MNPFSNKKKLERKWLNAEQKLEIINKVKLNPKLSIRALATQYGVGKTQIGDLLKRAETIVHLVASKTVQQSAKKMVNTSQQPELDAAVLKWFYEMRHPTFRCKPLPISRAHIQMRAQYEAHLRGLTNFRASNGWFLNWRKRNGIGKSVRLYGEAGDVNVSQFLEAINEMKEALQDYDISNIFNMDETGLFYRAMPARTYLTVDEVRRTVRGTKALKAKDRVTILLCVNATGTCKIDPLMIGTAQKPRCFDAKGGGGKPPIPYMNQKSAWVDKLVYKRWWDNVFLPGVRAWTKEPVALLMDNFSGHDTNCIDPTGQVSIFFFPPNSTSIHQPWDQGIISTVKAGYKKNMITKLIATVGHMERLSREAAVAKPGCRGLRLGCPATILDAAQILKKVWDELKPESIASCWRHSNCLPNEEGLIDQDKPHDSESEEREIHRLVSSFAASVDASTMNDIPDGLQCVLEVFSADGATSCCKLIDRWIDLEHDGEVMAADGVLVSQQVEEGISTFYAEDCSSTSSEALLPLFSVEAHCAKDAVLNSLTELFAHNLFLSDPVLFDKAKDLRNHLESNFEVFHGF